MHVYRKTVEKMMTTKDKASIFQNVTAKTLKIFKIKIIIRICMLSLFTWWGILDIQKYLSQPLTTDIVESFGDNQNGIQFPLLTFCPSEFFIKDQITKLCNADLPKLTYFMDTTLSCLDDDKNFDIDDFIESLVIQRTFIFDLVRLWTGSKYIDLQNMSSQIWSTVFHQTYGLCCTFDLSGVDQFKFVPYQEDSRPSLEFIFDSSPWEKIQLILHSKYDLPDAAELNGLNYLLISNQTKEAHYINILKKKKSTRQSTRKASCTEYEHKTCRNIEDNMIVLDQFKCSIPILYHGQHLDQMMPKTIPNCSIEVTKQAFDLILKKTSKCARVDACETTRYTALHKVKKSWLENKSVVWVVFESPEVVYHHTYINYDILSLIGDLGGILGLTLGASATSLLDSLLQNIPYY